MIGEWLYGLTQAQSISAPVIQRRLDDVSAAIAATSVAVDFPVIPDGYIGVLIHALIDLTAGAAQTVSAADLIIVDAPGTELTTLFRWYPPAPNNFGEGNAVNNVLIFPGEQLRARATFSAAAAANIVSGSAVVLLIPKGNLQQR